MVHPRDEESPQWPTNQAVERLNVLLGLPPSSGDWELEVADAARVAEFCDVYEAQVLDREGRFALMRLIVSSLDDYLRLHRQADRDADLQARVQNLLSRDFWLHRHTIKYWCLHDVSEAEDDWDNPEWVFAVTPLMRRVWIIALSE